MSGRVWKVGLVGTFDVENYGDQLFPLIAEAELTERLGPVELHCFSYAAKTAAEWPFPVTSVTELPRLAAGLDGLLVGGGFLIRFDKQVASGYGPPTPAIHHPTGFWLSPALIALQHGIPLLWNAPGVSYDDLPAWGDPLMELALGQSSYLAVRDQPSRAALARFVSPDRIAVVPDTVFGIGRLLPDPPAFELNRLREASGLTGPYVIIQGVRGLEPCFRFLKLHADRLRGFRFLALPVGPVNGDDAAFLDADLPGLVHLPAPPEPLLVAELIRQASAVIGPSFHLAITALTAGVPVFTPADLKVGKFPGLAEFDGIHPLPTEDDPDPGCFLSRLGRAPVSPRVGAALDRLAEHWDRVATVLRGGVTATPVAVGRFWQSLPGVLEEAAVRRDAAVAALQARGEATAAARELELLRLLALARTEIARRDRRIADLQESTSWRVTAPFRSVGRRLGAEGPVAGPVAGKTMIDLTQIARRSLETQPYAWAAIDGLYAPRAAAALAATYPRDHFKTVSGHDGEKEYLYETRALLGLGADTVAHADELSGVWRELARDLLSPEYRTAMSLLTGYDLTAVPIEANVYHYGPKASLGPHLDLPAKLVTHVLYFNRTWNPRDGGCLSILRSGNEADVAAEILPLVGRSAVLVRSDRSWHAVQRVAEGCRSSRRSVTVTFYRPGAVSPMWPAGDPAPLHRYEGGLDADAARPAGFWARRLRRFVSP